MNLSNFSPEMLAAYKEAITAVYSPQVVPRYQGQHLIEALGPQKSRAQMKEYLERSVEFSADQRELDDHVRTSLTNGLSRLRDATDRGVSLFQTVDEMMREGYVPRPADSIHNIRLMMELHKARANGLTVGEMTTPSDLELQLSVAFIGLAGVGKTSVLKLIRAAYPPVIYHPELAEYQVPVLLIETPFDGTSVKNLAYAVYRALDKLIPGASYFNTYTVRTRNSDADHQANMTRLFAIHHVGIVIYDEVQRLVHIPRNKQSLMNLFIAQSNVAGIPLLFAGTEECRHILGRSLASTRRTAGIPMWLQPSYLEWKPFAQKLWSYNWTRRPFELTDDALKLIYKSTAGIADFDVKLCQRVQKEAIESGEEEITIDLIGFVARFYFAPLRKFIQAIHNREYHLLSGLEAATQSAFDRWETDDQLRLSIRGLRGVTLLPSDPLFVDRLAAGLMALFPMPEENARHLASGQAAKHPTTPLLDALGNIADTLKGKDFGTCKGKRLDLPLNTSSDDYRHAIVRAYDDASTTIIDELRKLNALADVSKGLKWAA